MGSGTINERRARGVASLPFATSMKEHIPASLLELRRQFLRFLERRVHDPTLAEDILQGAYVRALGASGELRQDESAVAWFYRILRNAIIDHYRRRATESAALDRWAQELEREAVEPQLQETTCLCIQKALETLAPSYATLLREVDLAEGSLSSFAAAHGIQPGNAAVRAHRARTALRKALLQCCGVCATHGCLECSCGFKPR